MKRAWIFISAGLLLTVSLPLSVALSANTTLTFSPATKTVSVGDRFTVRLLLNAGQAVNASEATMRFSKDLLEAKSISKSGSVFTLWAQDPVFSNGAGTVTYSGGLPNPGVTGNGKTILTVTFEAQKKGTATLSLTGASVLANDGYGTQVLSGTGSATITIEEQEVTPPTEPRQPEQPEAPTAKIVPVISSPTHPDETVWYKSRDVTAEWRASNGVQGYSVVFDDQAGTVPLERSWGKASTLTQTVGEGIWYLHVRALYDTGWSDTRHFAVHVDATPPDAIVAEVHRESESSRSGTVTFSSADALSGLDWFSIKLDTADFIDVTSPYQFSNLSSGSHTIVVRALDKAGNEQTITLTFVVEVESMPPIVFADRTQRLVGRTSGGAPFLVVGDTIRLSGFARSNEMLRITVRSEESVFTFPVADIIDQNPVEPAPQGYTAWKVEIQPNLSHGDHEVQVQALNEAGDIVGEAPTIKFRVIANVAQVGDYLITFRLIVYVLLGVIVLLLGAASTLLLLYLRSRKKKTALDSNTKFFPTSRNT